MFRNHFLTIFHACFCHKSIYTPKLPLKKMPIFVKWSFMFGSIFPKKTVLTSKNLKNRGFGGLGGVQTCMAGLPYKNDTLKTIKIVEIVKIE